MAGRGFLLDLPDVLRVAGCDVYVMPGAASRSTWRSGLEPRGIIWHHTATSMAWADGHVAALLRDGRRDLAGPLVQLGLERDGTFVVVAMGRANHDGYGRWSNDAIGIEVYNSGLGETYPRAQLEALDRGTVALCRSYQLDPRTELLAHRESASHKIDPTGIDMNPARARIAARLEEDEMTPAQEKKLDDIAVGVMRLAGTVNDLTDRVRRIESLQIPENTTREGLRNIKRIGQHLDVPDLEGI